MRCSEGRWELPFSWVSAPLVAELNTSSGEARGGPKCSPLAGLEALQQVVLIEMTNLVVKCVL